MVESTWERHTNFQIFSKAKCLDILTRRRFSDFWKNKLRLSTNKAWENSWHITTPPKNCCEEDHCFPREMNPTEWMFAAVPRMWSFRGEDIGGVLKALRLAKTPMSIFNLCWRHTTKQKIEFSLSGKRFEIPREWNKTREGGGEGGEKKLSIEPKAWDEVAKQLSKMAAHKSAFQRLLCLSMPSLGKCNFFYFHMLYLVWLFRIFHVFRCQLFWFVDVALLYKSLMTGETGHRIFH